MNRKLKVAIVTKYLTQADFAQALKVHQSKVSEVVRGRRELSAQDQARWARLLGCTIGEIFGEGE